MLNPFARTFHWQDRRRQTRTDGANRRTAVESLENRRLLTVSIINGGGSGYAGNGSGGPPDVTGAAGPNSYLEITNNTVTLFSPKPGGTILAQHGISDFFYNSAIGNQTRIDQPFSGQLIPIAASPTGATESGTTVTITTTAPHGFSTGQTVNVSGVGVPGYNGTFPITGAPTPTTFTYTAPAPGLANSGGGTTSVDPGSCGVCDSTGVFDNLMGANGRFIIGDIDIDGTTNVSQYIFAVSKSNNPTTFTTADWNFYHITTTQTVGTSTFWTDYPGNPGFNADAFVETFNVASGGSTNGNAEIVSVNASDLANGVSQASLHFNQNYIIGSNNYRPTTMQDSVTGDPMWLIENPNDGTNLKVVKMTSVLSNAAAFAPTSLALPAADTFNPSGVGNPLNPDSTSAIDGDDGGVSDVENPSGNAASDPGNRILKAAEIKNTIVASHTVAVGTANVNSATVQISNGVPVGGTGYTVGDILTVTGGTFTTAATLTVATLGAGGSVATVTVANPGSYSSLAGITGAVTGGTGSGAKFNINFNGQLVAQWYAIDVSGATPAFQLVGGTANVGRIGFGANTYCFEPAIGINSSGEIGLGFMESDTVGGAANAATGGFISTFVTARKPTDAAGTMQPVVLVPAGTGSGNINGRIGDFSGMNVDPVNGTFWHVNEFGGGGPTDIANFTPEAPPTVTPPSDQTAVEGAAKSFNLGSFTDPDGGPWTATVNWGDGSNTTFNLAAAGSLGTQTHTYAEESAADHPGSNPYQISVTVTDSTLLSDTKTFNVTVSDPAVVPTGGFAFSAVEGALSASQTLATFTDPGGAESLADYSATIAWGDGNTSTGTISFDGISTFTVSGADTYGEEGVYTIAITIHHEAATDAVTTSTATVADPPVVATGTTITAIANLPLTGVTLATFTDPGGAEPNSSDPSGTINSHYSVASINWGDGTPLDTTTGTLSYGGSPGSMTAPFVISGSHTYASEGVYTVTAVIDHELAPPTTVISTVTVKDNIGLLALDPSGRAALTVSDNGAVTVNNSGAVVVNSSNTTAALLTDNASVSAKDIDVTGGVKLADHSMLSGPVGHETPTSDPIGLPLPSAPTPTHSAVNYYGKSTLTLSPGTYVGGIRNSGQGNIVLLPGIYYLKGGGLQVSGDGSLTGMGVLIVNAPNNHDDSISLTGEGNVILSAPLPASLPSGYAAYKGITIFQDPASKLPVTISCHGGLTMDGALYAPKATLCISGNGSLTDNTDTTAPIAEVIVYDVNVTDCGSLTINADAPASNPPANSPLPGAAQANFTSFTSSANASVPGQPVSFTVTMASVPASAGSPAGSVDFFDQTNHLDLGSVTLVGGAATLTTSAFVAPSSHVITATYFSSSPNFAPPVSPATLVQQVKSEVIESGVLFVGGNSNSHDIQVQLNKNQVIVSLNDGSASFKTPLAGLTGLVVYGQGDHESIQVDSHLLLPAFLFAGNGNDTEIQGGGGPTVEVGGSGGGDLWGGSARNILIAGSGGANLHGGKGGNILIGGYTDYDSNLAALEAALSEWSSPDSYATRIASAALAIFNSSTVHSDGMADQLWGVGGTTALDWFFASPLDKISGKNSLEIEVAIT